MPRRERVDLRAAACPCRNPQRGEPEEPRPPSQPADDVRRVPIGPFVAFQDSRHYELLESGNPNGPTCSTCHETVGGRLLSPKALEARCTGCHGVDEVAPRAGRAQTARQVYDRLAALRRELKAAQASIKKIADPARRAAMLDAYGQAEVPVIRAVNAGHKFVYDDLLEYAAAAEKRIDALLMKLNSQVGR